MNELKQNFSKSWHDMQTTSAWVLIFILTYMNVPCFSKTFWAELIATLVERTTHLHQVLSEKSFACFSLFIWQLYLTLKEKEKWASPQLSWAGSWQRGRQGAVACIIHEGAISQYLNKDSRAVQWQQRGSNQEFRSPSASVLMCQVLDQARESNLWVQDLWGTWTDTGVSLIWLDIKFSLGFGIGAKWREKVLNKHSPNSCTTFSSQSYPRFHSCAVPDLTLSCQVQGSRGGETLTVPLSAFKVLTETW